MPKKKLEPIEEFDPVAAYKIALARKLVFFLGMNETQHCVSPEGYRYILIKQKQEAAA